MTRMEAEILKRKIRKVMNRSQSCGKIAFYDFAVEILVFRQASCEARINNFYKRLILK